MKKLLFLLLLFLSYLLVSQNLLTDYQDSPPKYYLEDKQFKGLCHDILLALNNTMPNVLIQRAHEDMFIPWIRIQSRLRLGDIDVFVGMAKNTEREVLYSFTEQPVYAVKSTFAKLSSKDFDYNSPESLAGKRILTILGSETERNLKGLLGSTAHISSINTVEQGFQMLLAGRADLLHYHSLGLGFEIKNLDMKGQIDMVATPLDFYYHYIVFNKTLPTEIQVEIEEALQTIKNTDTLIEILEKYGLN